MPPTFSIPPPISADPPVMVRFCSDRFPLGPSTSKMRKLVLFPAIEAYEKAIGARQPLPPVPFGTVANPIRMMEFEHENAGAALGRLRQMTRDFEVPDYACVTYKAMLSGLRELEQDLHMHIHLENNILFPRALKLER